MNRLTMALLSLLLLLNILQAQSGNQTPSGKKIFETYCWGCHHQSAEAFGPSFAQIASQRDSDEIRAMIVDPASVSKVLGYKRNAMPPFKLTTEELDTITAYILSFKSTEKKSTEKEN